MEDCLFCKIANGTVPTEFLYEDDKVVAFRDIDPVAPVHVLIIPKKHFDSILTVPAGNEIISHMHTVACKLAISLGIAQKGFRLVSNCGDEAGQSVKHLHYHLLGGRSMNWPPG